MRWLGYDWGEHLYHASDYYDRLYAFAEWFIGQGLAYVDSQSAEEMRATRGTLTEPGRPSPYRDRSVGGEPRPLPPHARGRVPGRRARAAPEDRHGEPEREHARPGDLPHPPRVAPPHRRQVVRLPALRLHALHLRRARAHHALDLHARVPGPPAAVRLGDRQARRRRPARAPAAAADRVRAPQAHLRRAVEAQADPARRGRPRRRLGRPAHADAGRRAPPRLHARGLPPARRAHRRVEVGRVDRHERAGGRDARRPQRARGAPGRGARPDPAGHRQLSRRRDARPASRPTTRRSRSSASARSASAASCGSSATISPRRRPRATSASLPVPRCACATPTSSSAPAWRRTRRAT